MKVTDIASVLDLTRKINETVKDRFIPLFSGDAGIGKSEIIQQWARQQGKTYGFIDCRLAYYEAPDMVGLPHIQKEEGSVDAKTFFATPAMWPTKGKGILLLEEPNRANPSVLNTVMQLLTDRRIGDYCLPDGWIIAAVINPDKPGYAVNSMDAALKDRFAEYEVRYDKDAFVSFMKEASYDTNVISFVESGSFVYKNLDELSTTGDATYIAPRTFSRLNAALKCGVSENETLFYSTCVAILGKNVGNTFYKYVTETTPVTFEDFRKDQAAAIKKLTAYKAANRNDLLLTTVQSFIDAGNKLEVADLKEICNHLSPDHVYTLFKGVVIKEMFEIKALLAAIPEIKTIIKNAVKDSV